MNKAFRNQSRSSNLVSLFSKHSKIHEAQENSFLEQIQKKLQEIFEQLLEQKYDYQKQFELYLVQVNNQYLYKLNEKDLIIQQLQKTIEKMKVNQEQLEQILFQKLQSKQEEINSLRQMLKSKYLSQISLERQLKQMRIQKMNLQNALNSKSQRFGKLESTKIRQMSPKTSQFYSNIQHKSLIFSTKNIPKSHKLITNLDNQTRQIIKKSLIINNQKNLDQQFRLINFMKHKKTQSKVLDPIS